MLRLRSSCRRLLLAEKDLAPTLLFCQAVPEAGGLYAVVMYNILCAPTGPGRVFERKAVPQLREAIKTLHQHGFVHGDLRAPNVLVTMKGKPKLIDFDWCGKEGEARYPGDIALRAHKWHEGVKPGGLITKEHDRYMFKELTGEDL